MTGTLASIASFAMCLAMTSAFVLRVPKATPPAGSAGKKQASENIGLPLANDDKSLGAGGNALSRIGGNDAGEAGGQRLPWMPFGGGYGASCRHNTCPLHVSKGMQPEITQDGNVTVPIVGGAGSEEGESTKPIIIEDGNATLPIIVGGVDGEEGRYLGVASAPQNEVVVQHNGITVTLEDMASHEYFFGEEQGVKVTASSAHESASETQADEEDSTHVVSDNADLATDAILTTEAALGTDANIATDVETATDANLERPNQEKLSREASSDNIYDEARNTNTDATILDEEASFELTADGVASEASLILENAFEAVGAVLNDTEDSASGEEMPFDIAVDKDLLDAKSIKLFGPENPGDAKSIRLFDPDGPDDVFDDIMGSVAYHVMSDGAVSKEANFSGSMDDLAWSLMEDALTRGLDSEDLILDPSMDHLMFEKLYDVISGGVEAELGRALVNMKTSALHYAFFGPEASKAVRSLAKRSDDNEVVVDAYVQAVAEFYNKFEQARYRATADRATTDVVGYDIIDQMNILLFGPDFAGYAVDLKMACVLHDTAGSAFDEERQFNPAAADLIDEMNIWPFDPGMAEHAPTDAFTFVAHHDISDGALSFSVSFDDPVKDLVFSVVSDALVRGMPSEGLMLDPVTNSVMRSKLHEALTGRAADAVEVENLADAVDEVITSLLHDAFFGPEASKAVFSLAESVYDRMMAVDEYVRAVTVQYESFNESRESTPDSEALADDDD